MSPGAILSSYVWSEKPGQVTATIVTSNLDFTEWDEAFPANRLLASATLDRLRHNLYCLVLDGGSYSVDPLRRKPPGSYMAKGDKSSILWRPGGGGGWIGAGETIMVLGYPRTSPPAMSLTPGATARP